MPDLSRFAAFAQKAAMAEPPKGCDGVSTILDDARRAFSQRAATYGGPEDSFAVIAGHWNWWLQDKLAPGRSITAYDVAQMMVGFKQARARNNHAYSDNHVDAAGYSAIAGQLGKRDGA